jgi:hypothetical protein
MAKKNVGRLAGLAALAGAAYMMSKGKDKGNDDAGDQKTSSYTGNTKKVESDGTQLKSPAESIAAADKSDKSISISNTGPSGTTTPGPDKSAVDLNENRNKPAAPVVSPAPKKAATPNSVSEPSDKSIKLAPERRNLEANMSRGTRTPAKPVSTVSSSAEGMKDYKPRRTTTAPASTSSSSAEGMKNYKPRSTPAAPAATTTKVAGTPTAKSRNMLEEAKEEARRREAASQTTRTSTSSSASPATRTPFPGSSALNKKHGGAVKMASGGMAASRRGDGIASRGKTRCKMY